MSDLRRAAHRLPRRPPGGVLEAGRDDLRGDVHRLDEEDAPAGDGPRDEHAL